MKRVIYCLVVRIAAVHVIASKRFEPCFVGMREYGVEAIDPAYEYIHLGLGLKGYITASPGSRWRRHPSEFPPSDFHDIHMLS